MAETEAKPEEQEGEPKKARRYTLKTRGTVAAAQSGIDYAAELNEQQLEAVTAGPGAQLVIAGAGSGKTRTLTYRVAWLLDQGVRAQEILLLTFTNKAAKEMIGRVDHLLPRSTSGLWGGTFHSIGNRLLRRHPAEIGLRRGFSIMDRADQKDLLNAIISDGGFRKGKDSEFPTQAILADIFSFAVNTGKSVGTIVDEKYSHLLAEVDRITEAQELYEKRKLEANTVDFDDLLSKSLKLLEDHGSIAAFYQERFKYILVDEYQDTNRIQADFIDTLAKKHGNITVVGDDAQSIYSWRGADFRNILEFPKRYPEAKLIRIETNYRSVPQVLELANAAIAPNTNQFKKTLRSAREKAPEAPAVIPLRDNNEQAAFVAQRIAELQEEGVPLEEMAVLYRAHYQAMELEMTLVRDDLPYRVTSGVRFFEQAHIKDIAAFLKFIANPADEISFVRIAELFQGIGKKGAGTLFGRLRKLYNEWALENMRSDTGGEGETGAETGPTESAPPVPWGELMTEIRAPARAADGWDKLAEILDMITADAEGNPVLPGDMIARVFTDFYDDYAQNKFTDYISRKEDIEQFINFAHEFEDLDELLAEFALLGNTDSETTDPKEETGAVTLSSIHQAKGLEWRVVFIIWLCENMFPSHRSVESRDQLEEERRLFYVAVTRAKDMLYLTWPRLKFGKASRWTYDSYADSVQQPSRFLEELPLELYEEWEVGGSGFF